VRRLIGEYDSDMTIHFLSFLRGWEWRGGCSRCAVAVIPTAGRNPVFVGREALAVLRRMLFFVIRAEQ
jgi:hypothetical protein